MTRPLCGAPAPGGRRVCELEPGHPMTPTPGVRGHGHGYRHEDGHWVRWTQHPTTSPSPDTSPRLGQRGQILVSASALDRYASARSLRTEEARRELTSVLIDARHQSDGPPAKYRARTRVTGLDVTALVVPDKEDTRLLIVVAADVRDYNR